MAIHFELGKMDIFLGTAQTIVRPSSDAFAKNIRSLIDRCGANGKDVLANCCDLSASTIVDWSKSRHLLSIQSFRAFIDGLGIDKASSAFLQYDEFYLKVGNTLSHRFNLHSKVGHKDVLKNISQYLLDVIAGKEPSLTRKEIADRFDVSKGMLENAFKVELEKISSLHKARIKREREESRDGLQDAMNYSIRRCGSRMRAFTWANIFAELKDFDLTHVSQLQLDRARLIAIERYKNSTRRRSDRDVNTLINS
jgi:hypothetical protein